MSDTKASVYAKLIAARKAVGAVKKSGTNDFHHYDYATEADFMDALRPALDEAGLAVLVTTKSYDDQFSEDGSHMVRVGMEYTVVDSETGDSLPPSIFYGLAVDKGDMALYKSMTGAAKYWAAKTFLISTHDDPEADTKTDERAAERSSAERQPRGSSGAERPATEKQYGFLIKLIDQKEMPEGDERILRDKVAGKGLTSTEASDWIGRLKALDDRELIAAPAPGPSNIPGDDADPDLPF